MLVAQAGVRSLVEWLRSGGGAADSTQEVSDEVFAAAPRALARSISLQQTVALIKVTIDVVEEQVPHLAAPGEEQQLREAVLRFSREIAFAAARVYARAAESRGAWDARLQALLVDALLRGDSAGRAGQPGGRAGLGGRAAGGGGGRAARPGGEVAAVLHAVYRAGPADRRGGARRGARRPAGGRARRRRRPAGRDRASCWPAFGDGPVVVGPAVPQPGRGDRVGAGGAGRLPGGAGLAGRAAAGAGRRPAAGAGPGRRRGGPPEAAARRVRRAGRAPAASCWRRWTRSSPPAARWRAPPGRCSCTRTRCATGCGGSPR